MRNKNLWKKIFGCVMLVCLLSFFSFGFIFGCNVPKPKGSGGGGGADDPDEGTNPLSWLGYINAVYVKDSPEQNNGGVNLGGTFTGVGATDYEVIQGIYTEVAKIILLGLGISYGVGLGGTTLSETQRLYATNAQTAYFSKNQEYVTGSDSTWTWSTMGALPKEVDTTDKYINDSANVANLKNGFVYKENVTSNGITVDLLTLTTPQIKVLVEEDGTLTHDAVAGTITLGTYDAIRADGWKYTTSVNPTTVEGYLNSQTTGFGDAAVRTPGFMELTANATPNLNEDVIKLHNGNTKKLALEIAKICTGLNNTSGITTMNQAMKNIDHIGFTSAELQKIKTYIIREVIGTETVSRDDNKLKIDGKVYDTSQYATNTNMYYPFDHYYEVEGKKYAFDRNGNGKLELPSAAGKYEIAPGFKNYRGRVESIFDTIKDNFLLRGAVPDGSGNIATPPFITAWGGDYEAPTVGDLFMVPNATRIEYTLAGDSPIAPATNFTNEIDKYSGTSLTVASNTPTVAAPITGVKTFTISLSPFGGSYDFEGFEEETFKDDLNNTHTRYYMPKEKYIAVAFDFAKPGFTKCYYISSMLRVGQIDTTGYSEGNSDLNVFEEGYMMELLYNANSDEYTDINQETSVSSGEVLSVCKFDVVWTNDDTIKQRARASDTNDDGEISAVDINADWFWQDLDKNGAIPDIKTLETNTYTNPFWYSMVAGGDGEKIMKVIPAGLNERDRDGIFASEWLNANKFKQSIKLSMESPHNSTSVIAVDMSGIKDKPVLTFGPKPTSENGKFAKFAIYSLEECFAVQSFPLSESW